MNADQRLRDTEKFLHEQIPLTRAIDVNVESFDAQGFTLTAPLALNHNHLGTAFGGSLAAIVTLAGYGLLWMELNNRSVHLVISESTIKFRRPVRATIRATCPRPDEATMAAFKAALAANGKARIRLEALIKEDNQTAVEFAGTYVARR